MRGKHLQLKQKTKSCVCSICHIFETFSWTSNPAKKYFGFTIDSEYVFAKATTRSTKVIYDKNSIQRQQTESCTSACQKMFMDWGDTNSFKKIDKGIIHSNFHFLAHQQGQGYSQFSKFDDVWLLAKKIQYWRWLRVTKILFTSDWGNIPPQRPIHKPCFGLTLLLAVLDTKDLDLESLRYVFWSPSFRFPKKFITALKFPVETDGAHWLQLTFRPMGLARGQWPSAMTCWAWIPMD